MGILANVSLGDLLVTMLWLFFLFMWIWIFIAIISDLFRDHQMSGIAKVVWVVVLVFLPILGSLAYLIVRGQGMARRSQIAAAKAQEAFDDYVRETAGNTPADQLAKLVDMKQSGHISDEEFQAMKAKIVS